MIKRVREEKGGFTLAELLIVVAIILVLVAVAVPVFSGAMDSANASTDEANIRSGYAQAQVFTMTKEDDAGTKIANNAKYYLTTDAELSTDATKAYETKGTSAKVTDKPSYLPEWTASKKIVYTFTVSDKGDITVAVAAE
ncbi:prepilin-type N-terminal cleavage/methylation domain-containing protein [Gordonibacter sp. 28C]|uniref:prepilin-type N-terminal cleavage/methylation domain-containing protein n=1 Tax=Gordonibacter sp. 28C TaxID=2078569 RepID=UPI001F543B5E|nr:prepilin-type N-terminal cleavage/methylation domain-containing protein [Gordonibacter sp. 28C]